MSTLAVMNRRARRAALLAGLAGLCAAPTLVPRARADDDDKKLRDKKPAVVAQVYRRGADAWKSAGHTPVGSSGDDVFPSRNMVLKAWIPLNNFGGFAAASQHSGADCWGYTSPSGREYALMGLGWGVGVVDITDPANPIIMPTVNTCNSLWHDVTVIGHYAYSVTDVSCGVGISVIDLANIDAGSTPLIRNFSQGGHSTTHTMISNPDSGYLYACGGNITNGGLMPCATTPDPTFPTFAGPGWTTQYVHEAQVVSYTSGPYAGKEIGFLFAGGPYYGLSNGLAIVDLTNKAAPQQLCLVNYPGLQFCHQGWISNDRKYLYIDDELDGPTAGSVPAGLTRVFDISNLSTPRMVSAFTNGLTAIDHNQYTSGRYLYQSNYTSGLRVWDTSDPLKPIEVAYLDSRPEDDQQSYNGAWGNFPYFGSGTILISDIERGLFICRLSLLEMSPSGTLPTALTPGAPTPVSVQVVGKEAVIGSVSLMVSVNGGSYAAIPMAHQGGGLYTASLPAQACYDRVRYYFSSETQEAAPRQFTWPLDAASGHVYRAVSQAGQTTLFEDSFETDQGWTVQNSSLSSGAWARGTPLFNGGPGAVVGDGDGSGKCFVTGEPLNNEVNGGPTRLLSPVLDVSGSPEARVSVQRWILSVMGSTDQLITEISNNNGATWVQVDTIGPASGGWQKTEFRIADYVAPTAQVRVRFSVSDSGSDSVTEAGIDGFAVVSPNCGVCYANCDGSTVAPILNVNDFICFQTRFAAGDPYANCDGSSIAPILNVNDFICFQQSFAAGCP